MSPKAAIAFAMLAMVAISANASVNGTIDRMMDSGLGAALLDAKNSVPPITSPTKGEFALRAPNADGVFTYDLVVEKIDNMTMAHIHVGSATTNGPPVVTLIPIAGEPSVEVSGLPQVDPPVTIPAVQTFRSNFTAADLIGDAEGLTAEEFVAYMAENDMYVNIHTTAQPAGLIRGQIKINAKAATPSTDAGSPAAMTPPGGAATKTMASGVAAIMVVVAAAMF